MIKARRQPYKSTMTDFIAVRPIRLTSRHVIAPGTLLGIPAVGEPVEPEEIETREGERVLPNLRRFQIRNWFRAGRIAEASDPWAVEVIENAKRREAHRVQRVAETPKNEAPLITDNELSPELAALILAQAERMNAGKVAVLVSSPGGSWFEIRLAEDPDGDVLAKVNGKAALEKWLTENDGYPAS